jgi:cardiolipin synthase
MYHAKVLILDDAWVGAGSVNWDNRSFRLNEEANFHVSSRAFAALSIRQFERDIAASVEITLEAWRRRSVFARLAELLVWPCAPQL